eukprot:6758-Heterococcus_DN1.PRE.1
MDLYELEVSCKKISSCEILALTAGWSRDSFDIAQIAASTTALSAAVCTIVYTCSVHNRKLANC